ncbi:hypothetical protein ACIBSS_33485 [Micromonospora aurantiaca]|uniref:Uncharacterized protein n=1 Tax=Micromonospora aurantiaca (nom. illeg.) TaxID=47850 RepID=A0A3M9JWN8_9ACTN|nr:hypothetical protein [Micromonospora aurantiaca]ADL45383.1 hypothetical protein Micau_1831 [Micromonospora aurantiaca ATCC 27029]AXH91495.1 hypothetical protein DVH21_17055 [Micromonospora aurantiaca]RNH93056.1 hypothetical protein EEZ25_33475 [Micromonospora aurantiaca]
MSALDLESHGHMVHYMLSPPFPRQFSAGAYAMELLGRQGDVDGVRAVLAYCMAAPIAQELAAYVYAITGRALPLILFDGEPARAPAVQEQYEMALHKLREFLSVDEAGWTPTSMFDEVAVRERPEAVLRSMHAGLLGVGEQAATYSPGDAAATMADAEAIADFYLDWLGHLVAAHNTSWPAWGGPAYQIVSRGHEHASEWPGATRTLTVAIDASRNDLLRHASTAEAVLSILVKEAEHAA